MSFTFAFDYCTLRERQQTFAIPPIRIELEPSPYADGYNQEQLNMRRKAEVLKHAKTSQTNKLTKAERLSMASRKSTNTRQSVCLTNEIIYQPSWKSDVPGPTIFLYEDPNVPLYMYKNPISTRAYTELSVTNNLLWSIFDASNVVAAPSCYIASIYFRYFLNVPVVGFSIKTPVSLFIQGYSSLPGQEYRLSVKNIVINSLFLGNTIASTDPSVPNLLGTGIRFKPTVSFSLSDMVVQTTSTGSFEARQYIGNIYINNLHYYTAMGFIYDVQAVFDISLSQQMSGSIKIGAIVNVDPIDFSHNCILKTQTQWDEYAPFTMVPTTPF